MSVKICIVYHSGFGHTKRVADSIEVGVGRIASARALVIAVEDLQEDSPRWADLDSANAIIFGAPTYLGSMSAEMKRFMERTSKRWMAGSWADKLAAGFTNSGSQNGDKHNTLLGFVAFAAQHGMLWVNLNVPPANNHSRGSTDDLNRLGASIGLMTQSNVDQGPDVAPPLSDLRTAELLGERVAKCATRWSGARTPVL